MTGTGDPSKDVPAVQAAVDRGGTVVLAGNFNFGDKGRVTLRRNVAVTGRGETRIQGGFWTFFSPLPEALPAQKPGPQISIRNIQFDGALWAPINIVHARGLVVSGNRITNVRPHPYPRPNAPNLHIQQALIFGTFAADPDPEKRQYVPDILTGSVVVEDNVIDLATPNPLTTLGQGVWGIWTTGVEARIARNRVSNASRNGIEMIDNYRGRDGKGAVLIQENSITTPPVGVPVPSPRTPNGIVLGFFLDPAAGADPARNIKYVAERNVIDVRGKTSVGIAVLSDGAEVRNNEISATGHESQPIVLAGSNANISGNIFRGSGNNAMNVAPFRAMTASGNRLIGNDLRNFKAAGAQILFAKGAANNACAQNEGLEKVADEGSSNRCP